MTFSLLRKRRKYSLDWHLYNTRPLLAPMFILLSTIVPRYLYSTYALVTNGDFFQSWLLPKVYSKVFGLGGIQIQEVLLALEVKLVHCILNHVIRIGRCQECHISILCTLSQGKCSYSHLYRVNGTGEMTEPYGDPVEVVFFILRSLLNLTHCGLFYKNIKSTEWDLDPLDVAVLC